MIRKYLILIISILLCWNGLISEAQTEGYQVKILAPKEYVINSEIVIGLYIYSHGGHLPESDIFTISYDSNLLSVNTEAGINGVEAVTNYSSMEVDTSTPGELKIEINYINHTTILKIHFHTIQTGISPLSVTTIPDTFNIQNAEIKIVDYGDVNGDGIIDIVDALVTARKYVGLPVSLFIASAADVNCDQAVDIIDALLMAQYYVKLITEFPLCGDEPTPTTTPVPTPDPTITWIPGDINGDGIVDIIDCLLITQYLAGTNPNINLKAADANGDGVVDEADRFLICYMTPLD